MMKSVTIHPLCVLAVIFCHYRILLFYSILGEMAVKKAIQFQLFQLVFEGYRPLLFIT